MALLALGVAKATLGRKHPSLHRSYHLWLLFGSAACLVAIGLAVGEDVNYL
jgi:hypothetical protein